MAAFTAAAAIRDSHEDASIAIFSEEPEGPYSRPALSKGLWQGDAVEDVLFPTEDLGVQLVARKVANVDPSNHRIVAETGEEFSYGKLLLATGVRPRRLPGDPAGVHYLRTLAHYRAIRAAADEGRSFIVIGGGFLGAELAAALAGNSNRVTMVFPESGINGLIFPEGLSAHLNGVYRAKGVEVLAGQSVTALTRTGVTLSGGEVREADETIAAIGSVPAQELAVAAGIRTDDGIVVDEYFRTSAPDVFAAGDVARFPDPSFGLRRVEHEDQALRSGQAAGLAMAGEGEPYAHSPFFYADLFEDGYEALGLLDPRLRTVERWEERYRKGVVYYLDEDSLVRGVLLWNSPGRMEEARELLGTRVRSEV